MASIRETLGLVVESSNWYSRYRVERCDIGYFQRPEGSFLDYDNERFHWRSEYEQYLVDQLRQHFLPVLELLIDQPKAMLDPTLTCRPDAPRVKASPHDGAIQILTEET